MKSFILFFAIALVLPSVGFAAGIPIIDAAKVQQMIQNEIKTRINDARQEVLSRLEQKTGIDLRENQENSDKNIAANTSARITDAVSAIHNKKSDAKVAPYLDACSNVSIARTASATTNNSDIQRELPNRVSAFTRADRNPRFLEEILSFANYSGADFGLERQRIVNDLRAYERQRMAVLDDAIINVSQSQEGLTAVYEPAVQDMAKKERVDFLRMMLIGNGVSRSYLHGAISPRNTNVRQEQMVEEGIYQTKRSANLAGSMFNNDQTAVIGDGVLPIESALDAAASPENEERFGVEMTNNPKMMVDRVMLQRWALNKAARLAALLQEYRRGQVELLQLAALARDKALE